MLYRKILMEIAFIQCHFDFERIRRMGKFQIQRLSINLGQYFELCFHRRRYNILYHELLTLS